MLTVIVEEITKMTYPQFMQEHVFKPLGMNNSTIYEDNKPIAHRAYGYSGNRLTDQSRGSKTYGDGCVYTSAYEYLAWERALSSNILLTDENRKLYFTPHRNGYAFGWNVSNNKTSHSGSTIGFRTFTLRYPREKLTIVVFVNNANGSPSSLANRVANVFR